MDFAGRNFKVGAKKGRSPNCKHDYSSAFSNINLVFNLELVPVYEYGWISRTKKLSIINNYHFAVYHNLTSFTCDTTFQACGQDGAICGYEHIHFILV